MGRLKSIGTWIDSRLGISEILGPPLFHRVPRNARWWYVFGSATLTLLMIQLFTGVLLAVVYVPSAEEAHSSLIYMTTEQPLGWFIRALHFYSASGMVVMMVLHMTQVFLFAAYKYPRELTWVVGVIMFVITLGLAFSGQVLRWDQDAYWGVGVACAAMGRIPVIGPQVVQFVLGGPIIGGSTLSRFFAVHVFVFPALLLFFLALHLQLVIKKGISEPPRPGKPVDPNTYEEAYHKEVNETGVPFFPYPILRDLIFSSITVIVVIGISMWFGPYGPNAKPDPTLIPTSPRPDWYFLSAFAMMALCPPKLEAFAMLVMPVLGILFLMAIPFFAGKGERHPSKRPIAVFCVILIFVSYGVLTYLGTTAPWSPHMYAWSGTPIPEHIFVNKEGKSQLTPLELQGAVVFQNKDCRNCHAIDGLGGERGPDLTDIGARLDRDELIRQVLQGGGNMPAYGKQLEPHEVTALVSFLGKLKPKGEDAPRPSDNVPPKRKQTKR